MNKEVEKLIKDILGLTYEITSKTSHDAFVHYSGHTSEVLVFYYQNGYSDEKKYIQIADIYIETGVKSIKDLKKCKKKLKKILEGATC